MKLHLVAGAVAAGLLATCAAVVVPALATPASRAATTGGGDAVARAAECRPRDLFVARGRVEGSAGKRYLHIRLVNVGDGPCTMGLATRAGFRDWSGELVRGTPSTGGGTITLNQGGKARTVVRWADPGPVPAAECDAGTATLVTIRVPSLGRTWRVPLQAKVCTTPAYAPDSNPLH